MRAELLTGDVFRGVRHWVSAGSADGRVVVWECGRKLAAEAAQELHGRKQEKLKLARMMSSKSVRAVSLKDVLSLLRF